MSEATAIKAPAKAGPIPAQVRIVGKVTRKRRHERQTYTTVIMPARDEYSRPSTVEIRSEQAFGDVGDRIDVVCELGGYEGKPYQVTDRDTGERRTAHPVNLYLDLVI